MQKITFHKAEYQVYGFEKQGSHIIPPHYQPEQFTGDTLLWLLPSQDSGKESSECNMPEKHTQGNGCLAQESHAQNNICTAQESSTQSNDSTAQATHAQSNDCSAQENHLKNNNSSRMIRCGTYTVNKDSETVTVLFDGDYQEKHFPVSPCCDFFGNKMSFNLPDKAMFEKTFSEFYWKNLLNEIAERTYMKDRTDIREGYVFSTLNTKVYAGTYPAVDHEFHMKGRFAVGGQAEAELIRRMLLLQLKIMREDRLGLYRNVCAMQPDGTLEDDVWRYSEDGKTYAQMFRITANIEFVEDIYNYYSLTKDIDFIKEILEDLEKNCAYIERFIREDGFLDSHVYYEDQVMKDAAVLQAQLFAANSFRLMSEIELLAGEPQEKAAHYLALSHALKEKAVRTYPDGFWDGQEKRFIDWIDAKGEKHDHIQLLANQLPELFGAADAEQIENCRRVIAENSAVFDKFPSFLAAKIEDYTPSEIGDGGPYDLCAAGRYWCWDAEYLAFRRDGKKLLRQLRQVCDQAELDGYFMGERYDMNYVYYNTGADGERNWHGASLYYEYPNVWMYVFFCKYLGIRRGFSEDLVIDPLFEEGCVRLEQYGVEYEVKGSQVVWIRNLGDSELKIRLAGENVVVTVRAREKYVC